MTEKIDPADREKLKGTVERLRSWFRRMFKSGLVAALAPEAFDDMIATMADRIWHGNVPPDQRTGHVLRARTTAGMALKLLSPAHSRLGRSDVPNTYGKLAGFLSFLIIAADGGDRKEVEDVRTVVLRPLFGTVTGGADVLAHHIAELWAVRDRNEERYIALVLGDFGEAGTQIRQIDRDDERVALIRIAARQRILWSAWDVHRAAAASRDLPRRIVPWFLRPLVTTDTTAGLMKAMLQMADTAATLYRAEDAAISTGKLESNQKAEENVKVVGSPNIIRAAVQPVALGLRATMDDRVIVDVLTIKQDIRARTGKLAEKIRADQKIAAVSERQTTHEHYFGGLTQLAALVMVAYRYAEEEAAMLEIIGNPALPCARLFETGRPPLPRKLEQGLLTRALHLTAAYREPILARKLKGGYNPDTVHEMHKHPRDRACYVLNRLATSDELTCSERRAADMFDLSHHCRTGSAAIKTCKSDQA